jgi:hypothetical protein
MDPNYPALATALSLPATAQVFWDWGGGDRRDASGRERVRFSPQFRSGEIIVSFGDRRLYFVTRPAKPSATPSPSPVSKTAGRGSRKFLTRRSILLGGQPRTCSQRTRGFPLGYREATP